MIIRIKNLRLKAVLGMYEHEKHQPRAIRMNIDIHVEPTGADDLSETVDYDALRQRIGDFVTKNRFGLIETLAQQVLQLIMQEPNVRNATVEIEKPHAFAGADAVAVILSSF